MKSAPNITPYLPILWIVTTLGLSYCQGPSDNRDLRSETPPAFVRVNAHTSESAPSVLDLYAYGAAIIRAKDCTDPASWFYQGSMHAVPPKDSIPGLDTLCGFYNEGQVLKAWNSCPHMYPTDQQLNFLTWHRLYIYYYERNIRYQIANGGEGYPGLGEDVAAGFSLPYWDYSNQPSIPDQFRQETLTTQYAGLITNPLYETGRSPSLMAGLPIDYQAMDSIAIHVGTEVRNLCVRTMQQALTISDFLSLSDVSEFSRGLEDRLHNVMHDYIGGAVDDKDKTTAIYNRIYQKEGNGFGLMGYIPSAGFDQVFFLHHSNVDRMFAAWESRYGPVTIGQMDQYGGDWDSIRQIYTFWDTPANSWVTYETRQDMLDAVHAID
ncbi:MAG: tyrosinase family protein, partial [Cyclobacteriaceae bacterium]|nr:tyrosinase family protein [Cyclobacteriaceae bacterium]